MSQGATLYKNVRVFDPGGGVDARGRNVLVEGTIVSSLDAPTESAASQLVDGRGRLLCPGFVDLRTHLCEPGFSQRETTETALAAAAAGGYTTVVAMPTTSPTIDRVEVVEAILSRTSAASPLRVLPAGALSVNREGKRLAEMGRLRAAGCVLFTDVDRTIQDGQLLRYAMEMAEDLDALVVTHSVDESLSANGVMHEGHVSSRLALRGIPAAAETVGVARDLTIAELTGARLHIGHISTAAACELIRQAKRRGVRVTAEVSPFHLLLTDERIGEYDTAARLDPPLRSQADVEGVRQALSDGTIDIVATDHCPQRELDKNVEFDRAVAGAISLQTALSVVIELVRGGQLTLERAIASMTRSPAQVLGDNTLGRLVAGGPADLVLIDLEECWTFDRQTVKSRSHNSPFLGREFMGRVVHTMAGGVVAYSGE